MELTEKQIKEFIYYGSIDGKDLCDLKIPDAENKPHLDWSLTHAFKELDKNTIWNGQQVEDFLFKRIENLVKLINNKPTGNE